MIDTTKLFEIQNESGWRIRAIFKQGQAPAVALANPHGHDCPLQRINLIWRSHRPENACDSAQLFEREITKIAAEKDLSGFEVRLENDEVYIIFGKDTTLADIAEGARNACKGVAAVVASVGVGLLVVQVSKGSSSKGLSLASSAALAFGVQSGLYATKSKEFSTTEFAVEGAKGIVTSLASGLVSLLYAPQVIAHVGSRVLGNMICQGGTSLLGAGLDQLARRELDFKKLVVSGVAGGLGAAAGDGMNSVLADIGDDVAMIALRTGAQSATNSATRTVASNVLNNQDAAEGLAESILISGTLGMLSGAAEAQTKANAALVNNDKQPDQKPADLATTPPQPKEPPPLPDDLVQAQKSLEDTRIQLDETSKALSLAKTAVEAKEAAYNNQVKACQAEIDSATQMGLHDGNKARRQTPGGTLNALLNGEKVKFKKGQHNYLKVQRAKVANPAADRSKLTADENKYSGDLAAYHRSQGQLQLQVQQYQALVEQPVATVLPGGPAANVPISPETAEAGSSHLLAQLPIDTALPETQTNGPTQTSQLQIRAAPTIVQYTLSEFEPADERQWEVAQEAQAQTAVQQPGALKLRAQAIVIYGRAKTLAKIQKAQRHITHLKDIAAHSKRGSRGRAKKVSLSKQIAAHEEFVSELKARLHHIAE